MFALTRDNLFCNERFKLKSFHFVNELVILENEDEGGICDI
jgi:hypothetical protein